MESGVPTERTIGHCEILESSREGGMGGVYRARRRGRARRAASLVEHQRFSVSSSPGMAALMHLHPEHANRRN